jgi:effector-binding domain-containing protein
MTEVHIIEHQEQPTAGVRETVPMTELTDFFSRAFTATMEALQAQGVQPVGPPFGKYYGTPTDVVDVEAGFPVAVAIQPTGNVIPGALPAGDVAEAVHVGPYDTMESTYAEVQRYLTGAHLTPSSVMWECYLSDPDTEPDSAEWRTQICWPLA